MWKWLQRLLVAFGFVATAGILGAVADYAVTVGSGTTIFAFTCFTTKVCPAHTLVNSAGSEVGTVGAPLQVGSPALPLPSGAATSANQTNASQKTQIVDGSGNVIASTTNALNVNVNNANSNGQATMANSSPVVIASNQSAVPVSVASGGIASGAVASGAVASGAYASGSIASGAIVDLGAQADSACATDNGTCSEIALTKRTNQRITTLIATQADVCTTNVKTNLPISQNGTSSVQLIALSGSTTIYVCSLSFIAAGATTVAFTTGTGTACVTSNAAVIGTTTANIANSLSFAANGGLTLGNGLGTVAKGAASSELCMILGSNVFVSGNLTYVQL